MMAEHSRRRRLLTGCGLAATASIGLVLFAILYPLATMSEIVVYPLICLLTIMMGLGATLAIFNLKQP